MKLKALIVSAALASLATPAMGQESQVISALNEQLDDNAQIDIAPGQISYTTHVEVLVTITQIDKAAREIEVQGPKGNVLTLVAGPEVRNFEQMKVGDNIIAEYSQNISVSLDKQSQRLVGSSESEMGNRALPGGKPAATAANYIELVGQVVELDKTAQVATIRGPEQTLDFEIADSEQFNLIEVGDTVTLVASEAIAIQVRQAP